MTTIQYDSTGRMRYHPEYHDRYKKPWTTSDERYLIEHYYADGPEQVSFALGKTTASVMWRAYELRKKGIMPKRPRGAPRTKRTRFM